MFAVGATAPGVPSGPQANFPAKASGAGTGGPASATLGRLVTVYRVLAVADAITRCNQALSVAGLARREIFSLPGESENRLRRLHGSASFPGVPLRGRGCGGLRDRRTPKG